MLLQRTGKMVFMMTKWEILKNPFGSLALFSVAMALAPTVGFFLTAMGYLDPIIGIFYTIPDPWNGRGLTSFVMALVFVQFVVIAFIRHAFNEEDVRTVKKKVM